MNSDFHQFNAPSVGFFPVCLDPSFPTSICPSAWVSICLCACKSELEGTVPTGNVKIMSGECVLFQCVLCAWQEVSVWVCIMQIFTWYEPGQVTNWSRIRKLGG